MRDTEPSGAAGAGRFIPPMLATLGELPTDPGWCFELKWDGMRIEARCQPAPPAAPDMDRAATGSLTLWARSGRDVTSTFPELAELPSTLGVSAVLDGEVVVFDGDRPAFERLQNRIHVSAPTQALVTAEPAVYLLFDLLELEGRSTLGLPYHQRHQLLERLVEPGPAWRVPPTLDGDGGPLLELARQRGLEGVVAKRRDGHYRPGGRSTEWIKVKVRRAQEFVVGGWLPGQGRLAGVLGSLLVGVRDERGLAFAGAVGSGIGEADRRLLDDLLVPVDQCPFTEVPATLRPPRWVAPTTVVEVGYGFWPGDGNLRHPTYHGVRIDRDPAEVVRELPPGPPGAR